LEFDANSGEPGRSSFDPDGEIVSYQWIHDGLILGDGPVLQCNFVAGQVYLITLIVTDDDGAINGIAQKVFAR
jgi:hypothetical protein